MYLASEIIEIKIELNVESCSSKQTAIYFLNHMNELNALLE